MLYQPVARARANSFAGQAMKVDESNDGWRMTFDDAQITQIKIDFRVTLIVAELSASGSLTIEQPFEIIERNRRTTVHPGEMLSIPPVLDLFNADVESVTIERMGRLQMKLATGAAIEVVPSQPYEAWQFGWLGEFLFVSAPGGEVQEFRQPK